MSTTEAVAERHDPFTDRRAVEQLVRGHMQGRRWVTGERWTLDVEADAFVLKMERPGA